LTRLSLASAYVALFLTIGVYLPFFPVFLEARGFTPELIGLAVAIPLIVRLAALPAAGILSDLSGRPRAFLAGLGLFSAAGFALVGIASGQAAILAGIAFASLFWHPAFPLLESHAARLAALGRVDYGRIRLWGSIDFIAANLTAGLALDHLPAGVVVWMVAGPFLLFALTAVTIPELPAAVLAAVDEPAAAVPAKLVLGVAAAAFVQASHAMLYAFASLHWARAGLGSGTIGALWAIGVVAEIVMFIFGTRVLGSVSPLMLLVIGGVAAAVRFGALALDPPAALLFPLQLLHGLSFAASHLGLMTLIAGEVPAHAAGRAQTYASTAIGLALALATVAAGPLYAAFGAAAYAGSAALGAIGGLLALLALAQPQSSGPPGRMRAPW
jgi:PPP family 3-phenylpropionic acid transporter